MTNVISTEFSANQLGRQDIVDRCGPARRRRAWPWFTSLRRAALRLPPSMASPQIRGFALSSASDRLERIGLAFIEGYNAVIEGDLEWACDCVHEEVSLELRGFAFEGIAMGAALLDTMIFWRPAWRLKALLSGRGNPHTYLIHVGVGWMLAKMHRFHLGNRRITRPLNPLLAWLRFDGHGFSDGYFDWHRAWQRRNRLGELPGYARHVYDQGLGRSLWFVCGAMPPLMARTIDAFHFQRRLDLWSGVGLAACYAGGVTVKELSQMRDFSGAASSHVVQGAAFAAAARQRAGNITAETRAACRALCGMSVEEASALVEAELEGLSGQGAYEQWRRRIRSRLSDRMGGAN